MVHLDFPLLDDLVGQRHLVEDHLAINHFVDRLALHIEVDQLLAGDLGVEHVPDLVPRDGHGDGAKEDLLLNWPPGIDLGSPVVIWQLSRGCGWRGWRGRWREHSR